MHQQKDSLSEHRGGLTKILFHALQWDHPKFAGLLIENGADIYDIQVRNSWRLYVVQNWIILRPIIISISWVIKVHDCLHIKVEMLHDFLIFSNSVESPDYRKVIFPNSLSLPI